MKYYLRLGFIERNLNCRKIADIAPQIPCRFPQQIPMIGQAVWCQSQASNLRPHL